MDPLTSNPSKNFNLLPYTHELSHNDTAGHTGIFEWSHKNWGSVAQELGFANNDSMMSNVPRYEDGVQKYITWFRDFATKYPTIFPQIIKMYDVELNGPDRISRLFKDVKLADGDMSVRWSTFRIEHGPSESAVRNTNARVVSAVEESGVTHLSYYAQMKQFDLYGLGLKEGVEDYERGLIQVLYNLNAALKYHILKSTLEHTPCFYLNPDNINAGMRLPRTLHDCLENMEQHFNCFGKPTMTSEVILALTDTIFARQDRTIDRVIIPISKYDAFFRNGRTERYFYNMSGSDARTNQDEMTGALPASAEIADNIAGVEVISIPLLEKNTVGSKSSRILTAEICTGSHAVFLKDFDALDAAKYLSMHEQIGVCSWTSNKYDWYKYAETMRRDLRWTPTAMVGDVPDFSDGVSGRLNRPLLMNYLGGLTTRNEKFDVKTESDQQQATVAKRFVSINTKSPVGDDKKCKRMDPVFIYNADAGVWHPWGVMGEAAEELTEDRFFDLTYETLALRLRESGGNIGDASFNNTVTRCLGQNQFKLTVEQLTDLNAPVPTSSLGVASTYDERDFAELTTEKDANHTAAHIAVYPLANNPDFVRRWNATSELFDPFVRAAARLFLVAEPSQETFFLMDKNNIANRFSGIIADFSEKSDASTPILLSGGRYVGEKYVKPLGKVTTVSGETKSGASELGSFVGARITDDRNFLPLLFALGGKVTTGSSNGFMVDLIPVKDRFGKRVIVTNPRDTLFRSWCRENLNRPDNCPNNSKLVFFQGANAGSANCGRGDLKMEFSLLGRVRFAEVAPYMYESADFDQQEEQMIPGIAFHVWLLEPNSYFSNPSIERGTPLNKYSYAEIVDGHRCNTIAARADTVRYVSNNDRFELATGNHIRGPRTPGMVYTDQCQQLN